MSDFNFHDYEYMSNNKVLKIKLKTSNDEILVSKVGQRMLQAYQPAHTPITQITLTIIKDFEVYKNNNDNDDNSYQVEVEPEEIEQFELIEI